MKLQSHERRVLPFAWTRCDREIRKIVVTNEADGCFAVVDVDTLWRDGQGGDNHWCGRACKVYTRMRDGEWKLIMHTGLLAY